MDRKSEVPQLLLFGCCSISPQVAPAEFYGFDLHRYRDQPLSSSFIIVSIVRAAFPLEPVIHIDKYLLIKPQVHQFPYGAPHRFIAFLNLRVFMAERSSPKTAEAQNNSVITLITDAEVPLDGRLVASSISRTAFAPSGPITFPTSLTIETERPPTLLTI